MNIVLIGYRCSGKTSVGKLLAGELGREFVDLDALLEHQAGTSIESLVGDRGWELFRKLERDLIAEVCRKDGLVIAPGGGAVIQQENVCLLRNNGFVVWLKGEAPILRARMLEEEQAGKVRPSLTGSDSLAEIDEVLALRTPLYHRAADLVVDTSELSAEEVARAIMGKLPVELRGRVDERDHV
jgi:shikimate kinase